ncbi:CobW family GTP-binding protein [Chitinimonas lacunae]|uniref:CobW family GTP-binding protein n=1 Tax=Chitinimonas lacunae TaxID=1963018 RepID=A0ABV8MRU3_9NEIS
MRVPVNLITGFLGVGKTTAIRHLLAGKPADQYWAVLVNEFGEVGIDGATLSAAADGLQVVEVPGGCICCTTSPMLRVNLVRLLRARRPDRLLIEPSGLGHPAGILDTLRDPQLGLAPKATLTLVDPRHLDDPRYTNHEVWRDQIQLADVLVANKCDRADAEQIDRFLRLAQHQFPPKLACHTTSQGRFDRALLDLDPAPGRAPEFVDAHAAWQPLLPRRKVQPETSSDSAWRRENRGIDNISCGWVFAPDVRFDAEALAQRFMTLASDPTLGLQRLQRGKGVFHTDHGWLLFDWVGGEVSAVEIAYRRDSRVELIIAGSTAPDWRVFEETLLACRIADRTDAS